MKGKKAVWVVGSSFSLKKQSLTKIHMEDDLDLIDEESLLTEEDLRRPELPPGLLNSLSPFIYTHLSSRWLNSLYLHVYLCGSLPTLSVSPFGDLSICLSLDLIL